MAGEFRVDAEEQRELNSQRRLKIIREATDRRNDRQRPIGSKAVLNGKPVLWAGPDLEWQSPETFEKLQTEGYDGDPDYLRNFGWQWNRFQKGVLKPTLQAATETLAPIAPHVKTAYELTTTPLQRKALQIGSNNLMWGLEQAERPITATSRALNIHPAIGNMLLEAGIELATPYVSTTALKYGSKALKIADKLPGYPISRVQETVRDLTGSRSQPLNIPGSVAAARSPKVNALDRYDELVAAGYDMSKDTTIQRLINKVDNADNLPKHIKRHTDEAAYKIAVDEHIAKGNPTDRIREEVGVLVGEDGSVRQWESRGKMQLRGEGEATNTALNRELDRFLQSPQFVSYNRIANVRHFMKEIGFTGTEKEFRAMYELHHVNAIKVYSPFFTGLKPKQAEELRKLAKGAKIYLGNDPNNLVPLLKRKHTLDKDSIHTFMRENGIEGSSKWPFLSTEGNKLGSYDPQARMAALLEGRSVQERFEVLKGFRDWVQEPATTHLNKLLTAKQDLENLVINA